MVDNDRNHANQIRTGWVDMGAGFHPIRVEYYEDEGDENLELLMENGDREFVPVEPEFLYHSGSKTTPATDSKKKGDGPSTVTFFLRLLQLAAVE